MGVCGGGRYKGLIRKRAGHRGGWGTPTDMFLVTRAIFMEFLFACWAADKQRTTS